MADPKYPYFSLHTHSRYSFNDAMPTVPALVAKAVELGYPALGLTDHGNPSGTVQLYKACRKAGIEPLPGIELYVTAERLDKVQSNMHLTVNAFSETGYHNLVGLNNLTVANYYYKPRLDMADFAQLAEDGKLGGLMLGTGCYFGAVQQTLIKHGYTAARQIVAALASWFPQIYVELHSHGVDHTEDEPSEDEIVDSLIKIADELGLPYVVATDAHYLEPADQPFHDGLKQLVSFSEDTSEAIFPGGPYCLYDNEGLKKFFDPAVIAKSADHLHYLAERARVRLPELEAFQLKVPDVVPGQDADQVLRDRVLARAATMVLKGKPLLDYPVYADRLDAELDTIIKATMPGYILLVDDVCGFMRQEAIWFHTRGSATGSLVCFVLGITQHDPIRWGLRMDRFMSTDRTRPPDIDLDVEHERRDEVIAWLSKRFSVRQVGNHMQYSLTEEADYDGDSNDGKGSLLVKYQSVRRKIARAKSGNPQLKIPDVAWQDIPRAERDLLLNLAGRKLMSGNATHAAGYIVAPDEASVAQLPLSRIASRKANVTAYAKKDVEAMGYCKLDLLGLKTKTAVRITCEAIHERLVAEGSLDSTVTPLEWYEAIPENDKPTMVRIGKGQTEGMFQLSGKAMARGVTEMKPKKVEDLVAAQALYRPAMFAGKLDKVYSDRRKGLVVAPERHEDIATVTKDTYGIALYQEQVIELCRRIGMTPDELTDTLDAVKASNDNVTAAGVFLQSIKVRVHDLATARGWTEVDVDWLVDSLAGYADYSFNKAHSVTYGVESYRSAYLAQNYPLEFWLGVLTAYANTKIEPMHVRNARRHKVVIRAPHINLSGVTYKIVKEAIRKGLVSVKGIGDVAAKEIVANQPYASLSDFGQRVIPRRVGGAKGLVLKKDPLECGGAVKALYEADALKGLE